MRYFPLQLARLRELPQFARFDAEELEHYLEALEAIRLTDGIRASIARGYLSQLPPHPELVSWIEPIPERSMAFAPLNQAMAIALLNAASMEDAETLTHGLELGGARLVGSILESFPPFRAVRAAVMQNIHEFIAHSDWLFSSFFNHGRSHMTLTSSLDLQIVLEELSGAAFFVPLLKGGIPPFYRELGLEVVSIETHFATHRRAEATVQISPLRP